MSDIYLTILMFGLALLIIEGIISFNGFVLALILVGTCLILIFSLEIKELQKGEPAPSLSVLTLGGKYEVVDIYDKYIIVKSGANNNEKLKFIGPLNFGTETVTTGSYVKTAKSLEKVE